MIIVSVCAKYFRELYVHVVHRSRFSGEQVPTLYEALNVCKKLDLLMFLELKEDAEKVSLLFFLCGCFHKVLPTILVYSVDQEAILR